MASAWLVGDGWRRIVVDAGTAPAVPSKGLSASTRWGSGLCPSARVYGGVKVPDSDFAQSCRVLREGPLWFGFIDH